MAKSRPFGVTLLAIFALLATGAAAIHTLQMLHLWPVNYGEIKFFTFDLFGAIMWGIMVLIYLWVFRMLWSVNPQGWLFVTVISVINLIIAFLSVLGGTTWQDMMWSIVINGVILIYCLLPGTKAAFGMPTSK